jgi:hypothetical protein
MPHNKTLQADEIRTSQVQQYAAHALRALRAEAVGGSCRLAPTSVPSTKPFGGFRS